MSNKRWVLGSLTIIFILLSINSTFLFFTDTYHIVSGKPKGYYNIPNQKYLIVEHLLKNPQKYDTLIFGSSRVGSINPFKLKDKKAYNMTYGEGIPREHLLIIKLFIKEKLPIKHILIAFDDFSYQVKFSDHQKQFMPKSHYLATGESIIDFYKFYFFRNPDKDDFKYFKRKYLKTNYNNPYAQLSFETIYEQKKLYDSIKYVDNNNEEYINDPRFLIPCHYCGNDIDNTLKDIEEIVKITKENSIELVLLINPIHHTTYKDTNQDLIKEFRDRLSYIHEYYDFSIPNKINNNNANWVETSHYHNYVGDMILNRIYDNNKSIENFGVYIKKKN